MTTGTTPGTGAAARPSRTDRGRAVTTIFLAASVGALLGSLALPWWGETETLGASTTVQSYSPVFGVRGSCSLGCGLFLGGPPLGPINGTHSFSSLGLNRTAELYAASLGLVIAAIALAAFGIVAATGPQRRSPLDRWERRAVAAACLCAGVGAALVALLQPDALRADAIRQFGGPATWTASPSPETSFFGGCVRGLGQGLCSSGASAVWGPGYGWILIVVGSGLLAGAFVRASSHRRSSDAGRRSPGPAAPPGPEP